MSKNKATAPPQPPNRIDTHRIDTAAVREVRTAFPTDWIERDLKDRDYGIDLMFEIFRKEHPTGGMVLFQVKGTEKPSPVGQVKFGGFPVATLLYAEMFAVPFFLLRVSIPDKKIYFVWLQKYIKTKLELDLPEWREQGSVTIYFPKENLLNVRGLEKIARISKSSARRDEGLAFLALMEWVRRHLDAFRGGEAGVIDALLINLRSFTRLQPFIDDFEPPAEDIDLRGIRLLLERVQQAPTHGLDPSEWEFIDNQMTQLESVGSMFLAEDELDLFLVEEKAGAPY